MGYPPEHCPKVLLNRAPGIFIIKLVTLREEDINSAENKRAEMSQIPSQNFITPAIRKRASKKPTKKGMLYDKE